MNQVFIKHVKLSSTDCNAIIKSKWEKESVKLQIFVECTLKNEWKYYEGFSKEDAILKQCKLMDIKFDKIKEYLTSNVDAESILYDIENNKKFIIYMKECINSQDEYADIIYFSQSVSHVEYSNQCMEILLEQVRDLDVTLNELNKENTIVKKYQDDLQEMCDSYGKLVAERKSFEEKYYNQVIHLVNSKKKYIQENIVDNNVTRLNISLDVDKSDDSNIVNTAKKINEDVQPSTSKTPSKRQSSTNLQHRTPSKTPRRTPSKRFLELQQLSDSDDSFTVLSCDNVNKLSTRYTTDSLDTSRVFKNFKVKTPVKPKENQRESSVELKIAKSTSAKDEDSLDLESGDNFEKALNYQHAQNIDQSSSDNKKVEELNVSSDTLKFDTQDILEDEIPCSQEMPIADLSSSYQTRKSLKSRNKSKQRKEQDVSKKDPFEEDTINILNC